MLNPNTGLAEWASAIASKVLEHPAQATRHLDSLIVEELSGAIDNVNRVFTSSHVPDGRIDLLFIRGTLKREPDHYVAKGHGKDVITVEPLVTDAVKTDTPPVRVYTWDPLIDEFDLDLAAQPFPFIEDSLAPLAPFVPQEVGHPLPWLGI